jgi:hypothetical protein
MQGYFKRAGCIALRLMVVLLWCDTIQVACAQTPSHPFEFMEATIPQLQAALATGVVTSRDLVAMYLARIDAYDKRGPALNAISVTNLRIRKPLHRRTRWMRNGEPERCAVRCTAFQSL